MIAAKIRPVSVLDVQETKGGQVSGQITDSQRMQVDGRFADLCIQGPAATCGVFSGL